MHMKKSIAIIGAGMGGLAAGIYGQCCGFDTVVFEAQSRPGGQCTSWVRDGYVFDACIHYFGAGMPGTRVHGFWSGVGAMPCEMIRTKDCAAAAGPDGIEFHDGYDPDALRTHLLGLSPSDAAVIDEYIAGIRRFAADDALGRLVFLPEGPPPEKLAALAAVLPLAKYFRWTMGSFGARFLHPFLRKAFPLLHSSEPGVPFFLHLGKHVSPLPGDSAWPKGGSAAVASNMAARYAQSGGTLRLRKKVVKILTRDDRACGVELADGTREAADFVVSNTDGRKTILQMLAGRYTDRRIAKFCGPRPDTEHPFGVHVFLGVKRDLSSQPSVLVLFLEKPEEIAGRMRDHLYLQMYGDDPSMAPAGKGVIKVELSARPSYFDPLYGDAAAYRAEKERIADRVIALLEQRFPGLRRDVEAVDVPTLRTWERFMGGTGGCENYPNRGGGIRALGSILGWDRCDTLPGLDNFYFAGSWVTSAGALLINALSGKTAIQKICRQCGVKFEAPA
jgi:phytoene dehydrogenase-like protein